MNVRKWSQSEICIVINDKSQGSIAKHLAPYGLGGVVESAYLVSWPSVVRGNWTRVVLFCCILGCLFFWFVLSLFICIFQHCLFVSISQVIGCEDRLRNDMYCVEWGVKLYSNQPAIHLRNDDLLYYTFITLSAGERIFKIGEHLAKLQAKWWLFPAPHSHCTLSSEMLISPDKLNNFVLRTETVRLLIVVRQITLSLLSTNIKLL